MRKQNDNDLIDESSEESFPASDPPSWTAGRQESPAAAEPPEPAATTPDEPPLTRTVDRKVTRTVPALFLWAGAATAATSLGFIAAGKKQTGALIGMWVPAILLFGVYNVLASAARSDRYRPDLH